MRTQFHFNSDQMFKKNNIYALDLDYKDDDDIILESRLFGRGISANHTVVCLNVDQKFMKQSDDFINCDSFSNSFKWDQMSDDEEKTGVIRNNLEQNTRLVSTNSSYSSLHMMDSIDSRLEKQSKHGCSKRL